MLSTNCPIIGEQVAGNKLYTCVRYSNVNVVYIWFKYKDYMLYGRFKLYLTIRLRAGVFYEQIVIEAQPS